MTFKTHKLACLLVVSPLFLAGCNLAPDYQKPDAAIPTALPKGEAYDKAYQQGANGKSAAQVPWQHFVQDTRLQKVIALALANNRDLAQTVADVAAARATYKGEYADQFPEIDAGVSGTREKSSDGQISSSYEATLGLSSYEIDLFGKARNMTKMELETYLSSAETARAAKITLIGETATAWLTLAADKSLLKLAQDTAASAQKTMAISKKRLELGVDSRVDLSSAETTYQSARADVASYQTQVAQDINALNLLVGQSLDAALLPGNLPTDGGWLAQVPAGISSKVLLERPDVLAAEHTLKAANADIGVARAAYFPTLSLTASGGLASSALSDLFSGGASHIWSVAPSATLPIFDWGANSAEVAYTKAERDKDIAAYQYTLQTAFQETADALARRGTIEEQLSAQRALVSAAQKSYDLYFKRYKAGIDSFEDALTYQRTLYSAQQTLISTRLTELSNRVTLYRVLGGGLAGTKDEKPVSQ
ncbi:efflux transporter outer membrane subunit [Gallaecimonas mangrovi]|uniref:efflux transporter outer membrane subunit n=1 Tax=Gallaecimonas mangrovi TaxID=2291597 RepID=UPI000E208DB9|nr:efflux transporter outer membrane subunit [Gallaecimonas mangrovi]